MNGLTSVADRMFDGPGLVHFGLDIAVKFGGSLMADVALARTIASELVSVSRHRRLAVIPGGGPVDNLIESIANEAGLPDEVINPACMRAMDQTGILLAGLAAELIPVESLAGVRAALASGQIPVLLPSSLILSLDVFTRESVITSDTLGAYIAFLLGVREYIVLTNVDGVFRDYSTSSGGELIAECTATELAKLGATSVDQCLGPFLSAVSMPAWVLNGTHPQRISEVAVGGKPTGTRITVP